MSRSHTPLQLRKQLLVMRAAIERIELAAHMDDLRRAATLSAIFRNALPSDKTRGYASQLFELIKRHPGLASAASLIAARFKFPIVGVAVKWGGIAVLGHRLWKLWLEHDGETRRPANRRRAPLS